MRNVNKSPESLKQTRIFSRHSWREEILIPWSSSLNSIFMYPAKRLLIPSWEAGTHRLQCTSQGKYHSYSQFSPTIEDNESINESLINIWSYGLFCILDFFSSLQITQFFFFFEIDIGCTETNTSYLFPWKLQQMQRAQLHGFLPVVNKSSESAPVQVTHCHRHCWNAPPTIALWSHPLFGLHRCSVRINECWWVWISFLHRGIKWHLYALPC